VAETLLGGTIVKWNGATWDLQLNGPTNDLHGVWAADASHIWAVGVSGSILHQAP
jgi:hypothetical protein